VRPALVSAFFLAFAACGAAASLSGCKASAQGSVNTGKEGEVADFDKPMGPSSGSETRSFDETAAPAALLGARQDLAYKGATSARCKCLAAAVGQPKDSSFQWTGTRPITNADTQLVIALTSAGVPCDVEASGASYWGYETVGQDVVVVVETAKPGRPIAQGAIIPRPTGSGHIYIRPVDNSVPYGRPASGAGERCVLSGVAPAPGAAAAGATTTTAPKPASSGWTRIKTDEADPQSTRVEIP
jgi:hypothetical protein